MALKEKESFTSRALANDECFWNQCISLACSFCQYSWPGMVNSFVTLGVQGKSDIHFLMLGPEVHWFSRVNPVQCLIQSIRNLLDHIAPT